VGRPSSRDGPAFAVTVAGEPRFVGVVGFGDRGDGVVEMTYGIAPRWRGQGLATRAARLGGHWAARQPGVSVVELRIGRKHEASLHVAVKAGFVAAGTVTQVVPGTAQTFVDLHYVLAR
jgi:RimJ/RimL family protein N-acetyltransferase